MKFSCTPKWGAICCNNLSCVVFCLFALTSSRIPSREPLKVLADGNEAASRPSSISTWSYWAPAANHLALRDQNFFHVGKCLLITSSHLLYEWQWDSHGFILEYNKLYKQKKDKILTTHFLYASHWLKQAIIKYKWSEKEQGSVEQVLLHPLKYPLALVFRMSYKCQVIVVLCFVLGMPCFPFLKNKLCKL